jgi:hypothetical protein
MTNKPQKKFIVLIRLPDGGMKNVIMYYRVRPGQLLEDGSKVVKVQ